MRARGIRREPVRDRAQHFELGERGEALAIDQLERLGYRIVAANFSLPIGRNRRDAIVTLRSTWLLMTDPRCVSLR